MRNIKKFLSVLLVAALAFTGLGGIIPIPTAHAAGVGIPTLQVNTSVVGFAGHEWWMIGGSSNGVHTQTGNITLLAKINDFGDTAFRTGSPTQLNTSWTYYPGDDWYYEGSFNQPNDYADSTLQRKMESIAAAFPAKEAALITPRTLTAADDSNYPITGGNVSNQKLWALSFDEWNAIGSDAVSSFGNDWRLRSASDAASVVMVVSSSGDHYLYSNVNVTDVAARPAFNLNLSSGIFASDASGANGKSAATVGNGLIGASAPTGAVKFTILDGSQALNVTATSAQATQSGSTLNFSYKNATTGANQYVSCILTDNSGAVKYYGKLADSSSDASGGLSIPLAGVTDGVYTLKLFSEEANGDNYTDFASTPIEMDLNVTGGIGTVSNFGGTELSGDAGLTTVAGQNITATGTGTASSPKTASIAVANNVASITTSDITVATNATFNLYSDSGFSQNEDQAIALTEGSNNHLYIKVIAEDGTTLYYDLTVTRNSLPLPAGTAPTIMTSSLLNGTVGTAYSQTLSASGDTPITWTLDSGSLPDGLNLSPGGVISGTPSKTGSFPFKVKAANGISPDATKEFSINILAGGNTNPTDTTPPTIISIKATPYGTTGAILEVVATDVSMPLSYQWQRVNGPWIDIPGATAATFDYSGLTPNTSYTVRVKVTDAKGNTAISQEVTFKTGSAAITGLPDSYTLIKGQSVSWTPAPTGGTWSYDKDYLSMLKDGDTYTFKALKTGKTSVTYAVYSTEHVIQITINESTIPQTGDTGNPFPFVVLGLASLCGIGALVAKRKRRHA